MKNSMKQFGLIALMVISTMVSTQAMAGGKESVKRQVMNRLYHEANQNEGVVNAKFTVDDDGTIELEEVSSSNRALKDFVKHRLEGVALKMVSGLEEREFNLNILFMKERRRKG